MKPATHLAGLVLVTLFCAALWPAVARADPVTWPFDLATSGEDKSWTSPTALDPNADVFTVTWNITLVEVTLKPPIFPPFTIDVTDQIPPEQRTGTETRHGPAPFVASSDHVVYPDPPVAPAFEADVEIGLNAGGYGYVLVTNVVLGTYVYNGIPMEVRRVRIAGTVVAEARYVSHLLGDMNCDGVLNFADINPFVLALGGEDGYWAQYPECRWLNADCNGDGQVNFADINPFVALLSES